MVPGPGVRHRSGGAHRRSLPDRPGQWHRRPSADHHRQRRLDRPSRVHHRPEPRLRGHRRCRSRGRSMPERPVVIGDGSWLGVRHRRAARRPHRAARRRSARTRSWSASFPTTASPSARRPRSSAATSTARLDASRAVSSRVAAELARWHAVSDGVARGEVGHDVADRAAVHQRLPIRLAARTCGRRRCRPGGRR